jgi:hypothetical protein
VAHKRGHDLLQTSIRRGGHLFQDRICNGVFIDGPHHLPPGKYVRIWAPFVPNVMISLSDNFGEWFGHQVFEVFDKEACPSTLWTCHLAAE